ncbi:MAG: hypothetical protein D6732_07230 [Methanobacteriota archaeon]|nr:MAG: hypothetical protein D6732_07230 [Euryarchaeota archaeon]
MEDDYLLDVNRRQRLVLISGGAVVGASLLLFVMPDFLVVSWLILVMMSILGWILVIGMLPKFIPIFADIDWSSKGYTFYGEYSERIGLWLLKAMSVVIPLFFLIPASISVIEGFPGAAVPLFVLSIIFFVVFRKFSEVRIDVMEGKILLRTGFFSDEIEVGNIARITVVDIRPVWEYGGYGRRWGVDGTIGYITGNRGVRIDTTDKKSYVISLPDPEGFVAMFRRGKSSHLVEE